jgi:hypothetical protein
VSSRKARHTSESKGERERESAREKYRLCDIYKTERGREGEVQKLCRTQSQLQEGVGLREKCVFFFYLLPSSGPLDLARCRNAHDTRHFILLSEFVSLVLTAGTGKYLRRFVRVSSDDRAVLLSVTW